MFRDDLCEITKRARPEEERYSAKKYEEISKYLRKTCFDAASLNAVGNVEGCLNELAEEFNVGYKIAKNIIRDFAAENGLDIEFVPKLYTTSTNFRLIWLK